MELFCLASKTTSSIERNIPKITNIDHIALACEQGKILQALEWYIRCLGFHQFLCNDEDTDEGLTINGKSGGLKTIVAASSTETCALQFVFVEALSNGNKKNQIHEFIEFNGNRAGVQHIALHTENIIETVQHLKNGGVEFITVPLSYYEELFANESNRNLFIEAKDHNKLTLFNDNPRKLQELGILMDISYKKDSQSNPNFILQTFAVPLQDRPTYFFELISRKGSRGFGERTIKALFEAIERLQQQRSIQL